jgi:hypothetical protein
VTNSRRQPWPIARRLASALKISLGLIPERTDQMMEREPKPVVGGMEAFNFRLRPAYKEQGRLFMSMSQVYLVFSMTLAYHIVLQHGEVALFTRLGGAGQVDEG